MKLTTNIYASHFENLSHRILHLYVKEDEDGVKYKILISSHHFCIKVGCTAGFDGAKRESILSVLSIMAKHRPLQGIHGQIFESFCHGEPSSGKTFTVKSLTSGTINHWKSMEM